MIEKIDIILNKISIKLLRGLAFLTLLVFFLESYLTFKNNDSNYIMLLVNVILIGNMLVSTFKKLNSINIFGILIMFYYAVCLMFVGYFKINDWSTIELILYAIIPLLSYVYFCFFKNKINKF